MHHSGLCVPLKVSTFSETKPWHLSLTSVLLAQMENFSMSPKLSSTTTETTTSQSLAFLRVLPLLSVHDVTLFHLRNLSTRTMLLLLNSRHIELFKPSHQLHQNARPRMRISAQTTRTTVQQIYQNRRKNAVLRRVCLVLLLLPIPLPEFLCLKQVTIMHQHLTSLTRMGC